MNIGIDVSLFKKGEKQTGIGVYTYEIIKILNKIDQDNRYFLFSNTEIDLDIPLNKNWEIVIDKFKGRTLWINLRLNYLTKKHKIDVLWATNHVLPLIKSQNVKSIVTIHDLASFKFKNVGSDKIKIAQKLFVRRSCNLADGIIAISASTKKDIIEIFNLNENKIKLVYNGGLSTGIGKPKTKDYFLVNEIRNKFNILGDYLLYLGTIEPRKNISTLIGAFNKYKEVTGSNAKLVLAGGLGWNFNDVLEMIESSVYKEDIIQTGYISNEEKYCLYSDCKAFVYPSIYEGFGIPILEAMSYEVPIITTNVSSLPEVGGDAVFYLQNVSDTLELSELLQKVESLNPEELLQIFEKEKNQLAKFTWEKCAAETLKVITSVKRKI